MLSIRKVEEKDLMKIFHWSNDEITRTNSLSSARIELEEHAVWFSSKLNNKDAIFFMTTMANEEVSFVRFEKKQDSRWYVGIVVSPDHRGRGFGNISLKLGIDEFNKYQVDSIYAQIKKSNLSSIRIFENNDFEVFEESEIVLYRRVNK
jgi:RimJ/RimL family protein N-acetyltransferase